MSKDNEPFPETADIESSSDEYARRFSGAAGEWMLEVQERATLNFFKGEEIKTVLDVGGGHGQLAIPLCEAGYEVTVLSSAPECKKRISSMFDSGKCGFIVGNVIDLPFPDKSFDVVISFRMVTHCRQWQKLIAELSRVSKKFVVLDYPTGQSLNMVAPRLFDLKKKVETDTRHWALFKHTEISDELNRNGFQKIKRTGQFFLPMVLHRMLKSRKLSAALEGVCQYVRLRDKWGSPRVLRADRAEKSATQQN